jgi:hypothetical protein
MPVDDARRYRLYEAARQAIGEEEAATLMEYLPPSGWTEIATRHDLDTSIAGLRAELLDEFDKLRGEFGRLRGEFGELRGEVGELQGELRAEMRRELREQTTRIITWMIPTWLSSVGIALAVRLG